MAKPVIAESAFIAPGAVVCGDVHIGENCSVYFNSTLRSDRKEIIVGDNSNIQDNSMLHASPVYPIHIGKNVSVGHSAILHGCTIHDNVIVGMGAIVMNGVEVGEDCIIAAGALLTQNKKIPANSLVVGAPGKVVRELTEEERERIRKNAKHYAKMSAEHKAGEHELYENDYKILKVRKSLWQK